MKNIKNKYGPWALITGASSGIGKEFAKQLAQQGLNLVLVARRKERLEKLGQMLKSEYSISVKIVIADLIQNGFIETIRQTTVCLKT